MHPGPPGGSNCHALLNILYGECTTVLLYQSQSVLQSLLHMTNKQCEVRGARTQTSKHSPAREQQVTKQVTNKRCTPGSTASAASASCLHRCQLSGQQCRGGQTSVLREDSHVGRRRRRHRHVVWWPRRCWCRWRRWRRRACRVVCLDCPGEDGAEDKYHCDGGHHRQHLVLVARVMLEPAQTPLCGPAAADRRPCTPAQRSCFTPSIETGRRRVPVWRQMRHAHSQQHTVRRVLCRADGGSSEGGGGKRT